MKTATFALAAALLGSAGSARAALNVVATTEDLASIVPSDPLVGGLPAGGRARIRGSLRLRLARVGPEIFTCGRDRHQGWWRRGDSNS